MTKWKRLSDACYSGRVVHEIECPECKYRVTYHGNNVPRVCICCARAMEGVDDDERNDGNVNAGC